MGTAEAFGRAKTHAIAIAIAAAAIGCSHGDSPRGDAGDEAAASTSAGQETGLDDDGPDDAGSADASDGPAPDAGVPVVPTCEAPAPTSSLALLGVEVGVRVGHVPELGLSTFTVEAWIRWEGYGTPASSGVGGVVAEPIASKGRGEDDGSNIDCNYFVGVDATGHLVADFEDMAEGANHPAIGTGTIEIGRWTHVAASFDGASWRLYVDGMLDTTVAAAAMPRADSIQHFGIGAGFDSMGVPQGSFDGRIDEVRVWNRPLAELELQLGMHADPAGEGLVARWPLDETAGTVVPETIAGFDGELGTATWASDGRPLVVSTPPAPPLVSAPAETVASGDVELALQVFDADDDEMVVRVYGREIVDVEPFSVVVLPDTQYYCSGTQGGQEQMFYDQTQWIWDNAEGLDIRAVLHVGDLVHNNHESVPQWGIAQAAMAILEQPLPSAPTGVPYGIAIGNHDQAENSLPGETQFYNQYFGIDRFEGRPYYGGHFADKNDASFITFEAGGLKFLALFFEYDQPGVPPDNAGPNGDVLAWARRVVADHPDHHAFVVAHSCLVNSVGNTVGTPFSEQGLTRYNALKGEPNLRLQFCGHVTDEGRRTDVAASTVHTLLSDYQFDGDGGSSKLRLLTFRPREGELEVQTYSPFLDQWYETPDSHFTLPIDLDRGGGEFELVGEVEHVESGTTPSVVWPALPAGGEFEWYATVSDCTHEISSERRLFTTQ